jgi:hypothetical protein
MWFALLALLVAATGWSPARLGADLGGAAPGSSPPLRLAQAPVEDPGRPAPAEVVQQIQAIVSEALRRFEAMDTPGVLVHVSEQYHTGIFTKPVVREQLVAMFSLYDKVEARVRIDTVRMVGDRAWVFTTGYVSGRLRLVGAWTDVLGWERELEVARREDGTWRLYGYQQ